MKREIKFRMWRDGKMQGVHTMYSNGSGSSSPVVPQNFACSEDREILMQYTGLKDKNGKEIYEGDILSGWRKGSNSDRGYTGVVFWQIEQAGYMIRCGKYLLEILSLAMEGDGEETRLSSFEIIGNIYEHPHLLTTPSPK